VRGPHRVLGSRSIGSKTPWGAVTQQVFEPVYSWYTVILGKGPFTADVFHVVDLT